MSLLMVCLMVLALVGMVSLVVLGIVVWKLAKKRRKQLEAAGTLTPAETPDS